MKNKSVGKFWFYWERFGILAFLAVTLIVFAFLDKNILGINNLLTVFARSAIVGIAACGMTFAICAGGFDLSVGAILGMATCVFAATLPKIGLIPATILTLVVGAVCGMLNGFAVTKLKIQTFVATLAVGMIIKGAALIFTKGSNVIINRTLEREAKVFIQGVTFGTYQVQLAPILMMLVVFTVGYLLYRYTRFGVFARSVGSNESAARTSSIPVDWTLIIIFMATGVTASFSGLIRAAQLMKGYALAGDGFELEVITATILGGTSLAGGKGNIWGTMIGAIMLALVRNGLNILGLPDEYQRLSIGLILLLALTVSGIRELTEEASR